MFVFVRLMGTSRADNEVANRGYPQVRRDFERAAEIARQVCVRETDHHQLVSQLTIMTASPATMVPRMGPKTAAAGVNPLARATVRYRTASAHLGHEVR
jgi:hypothetical protein